MRIFLDSSAKGRGINSSTIPAVLHFQIEQIQPKFERQLEEVISAPSLKRTTDVFLSGRFIDVRSLLDTRLAFIYFLV